MPLNPISTIKADLGIQPNGRVQRFFTRSCYKHMDKYVPMDEGNLRTIVDIQPSSITYEQEYAEAQYYGIVNGHPVRHYTTPGTGSYWDKRMWNVEKDKVIRETQNYIEGKK